MMLLIKATTHSLAQSHGGIARGLGRGPHVGDESEIQCVEVQEEALWGDAVMFHERVLGIASEAFQAIDVYSSGDEMFPRVHLQIRIATEHRRVMDLVSTRADQAASAHFLECGAHDVFPRTLDTTSTEPRPSLSKMPIFPLRRPPCSRMTNMCERLPKRQSLFLGKIRDYQKM